MPKCILRRCTICQKYGAAYLVNDPQFGELRLCYTCWKERHTVSNAPAVEPTAAAPTALLSTQANSDSHVEE